MTDIVERLRSDYAILKQDYDALREQVASSGYEASIAQVEIERLRAEVAILRTTEAAEIERLRALAPIVREQGFEIERLRDHMRALADTSVDRDTAGIFKGLWHGSEKECDELRAELERLRAALQQIVAEAESDDGLTAWDGAETARRALEPKP